LESVGNGTDRNGQRIILTVDIAEGAVAAKEERRDIAKIGVN
jgi:hypothetical protein